MHVFTYLCMNNLSKHDKRGGHHSGAPLALNQNQNYLYSFL